MQSKHCFKRTRQPAFQDLTPIRLTCKNVKLANEGSLAIALVNIAQLVQRALPQSATRLWSQHDSRYGLHLQVPCSLQNAGSIQDCSLFVHQALIALW